MPLPFAHHARAYLKTKVQKCINYHARLFAPPAQVVTAAICVSATLCVTPLEAGSDRGTVEPTRAGHRRAPTRG